MWRRIRHVTRSCECGTEYSASVEEEGEFRDQLIETSQIFKEEELGSRKKHNKERGYCLTGRLAESLSLFG
jgi:hypothetical protein